MNKTITELFENHQIRKSKKQKGTFIEFIKGFAKEKGYSCKIEKGSFGARNIVIGKPESARVVYTAHYDTCAKVPFPNLITPKNIGLYLLYQLLITAFMLIPAFAIGFGAWYLLSFTALDAQGAKSVAMLIGYAALLVTLVLMIAGPANKHTANDNTSGVATVLTLMDRMPEELRTKAAFILFDLEEAGLIGSSSYAKAHKRDMSNTLLINFDCVSDGKNILFCAKKKAALYRREIVEAFESDGDFNVEFAEKGFIYPSDQASFPVGIGVAALKKTKSGVLYMDKIHTKNDTVFEEKNIEFLADGAIKLTEIM